MTVDVELVHAAAVLVGTHGLGWDQALDVAAARRLSAHEVVVAAADPIVLDAASKMGLATASLADSPGVA